MLRELFLLVLVVHIGSCKEIFDQDRTEKLFRKGLDEYIKTNKINHEFRQALEVLQFPGLLIREDYCNTPKAPLACMACNVAVDALMIARRHGMSSAALTEIAIGVCILFGVGSVPFCRGTIGIHSNTFIFMFDNKADLTSQRVCAVLLHSTGCKDPAIGDGWTIELPELSFQSYEMNNGNSTSTKAAPLKILQISDPHYDPNYTVGSNAACNEAMCCLPGTVPKEELDAAGYWGDYRGCDTPWHALINSLEHITAQHKHLDYVYYTGDIVDHKVWDTSIEHNTRSIIKVLDAYKEYFGDIPVFPILGNHEPHPVNSFSSDGVNNGPPISTQWVFELSVREWKTWLPEDTRETILEGGYYTILVKPGFRVVALNSNVCYTSNWWLIYDDVDPYGQLQWLVKVLKAAEENGEKVHILSHVPTADSTCWFNWGREYARVVRRFASTIAAQFNGHTHTKENVIYYDSEDLSKPVNVAFNGASITAFRDVNPNYVVYDVDPDNAEVLDYELWIYDITEANKTPELPLEWYKLYSFKEAYGASSLKPAAMADLVIRFTKERELIEQYFRFKSRNAKPALDKGCNDDCHIWNLCYMVTSYHGDTSHCEEVKKLWNASKMNYTHLA